MGTCNVRSSKGNEEELVKKMRYNKPQKHWELRKEKKKEKDYKRIQIQMLTMYVPRSRIDEEKRAKQGVRLNRLNNMKSEYYQL